MTSLPWKRNKWAVTRVMTSPLPPLVSGSPGAGGTIFIGRPQTEETPPPPPPVTFKPVSTKADKFAKLMRLDKQKLQRPKAHFRNALKTTEGLERATKQLERRLEVIESKGEGISFERLSAFRDAFDDVIKLSHTYGPKLNQIKEVYNERVLYMLSQQQDTGQLHIPGAPITYCHSHKSRDDLANLRKKVHQLEVESRVLLQENEKLSKELSEEVEFHGKELTRIREEGEAEIRRLLAQPPPLKDYAGKVEELQEKIGQREDAISREFQSRKGSVPLTVCHNLEQCLREVEIETQKHQRRNKRLREDIKKSEEEFIAGLQDNNLKLSSDLRTILGFS